MAPRSWRGRDRGWERALDPTAARQKRCAAFQRRRGWRLWVVALCLARLLLPAETARWTLTNHASDYSNELVRLKVRLTPPFDATRLVVTEDGNEVPVQVEVRRGTRAAVEEGDLWVCTTIPSKYSHEYTITTGGQPKSFPPRVKLAREGGQLVLDNGLVAAKVPTELPPGGTPGKAAMPGPITAIRAADGPWRGGSSWQSVLPLTRLISTVIGDGPLFAKVKLRYQWSAPATALPHEETIQLAQRLPRGRHALSSGGPSPPEAFAEITILVVPDQPLIALEEHHAMIEGDAWMFDLSRGWQPRQAFFSRDSGSPKSRELKPDPGLFDGATVMFLQPRWTQSTNCGWFFAARDDLSLMGVVAMRAGKWDWPYDNQIIVQARPGGDTATLVYPTWKGRRFSYLLAGPVEMAGKAPALIRRAAMQPLDKLANEYMLEWPGLAPGGFQGTFWWDGNNINPSSMIRGYGRRMLEKFRQGSDKPDRPLLSQFQVFLDTDCYAFYRNRFSPINPNFSTDLLKVPIGMCAGLKGHPEFPRFRQRAEEALRMDVDHAVTLPGGAGQECPGYLAHSMSGWLDMAELCKTQLGFDPREWPRAKAAASFLLHTSQPVGEGKRRILPAGDTHPPGPEVFALAEKFGVREKVVEFKTEELPGFGAVFRSHSGQANENFLAFKAGPNRGHYHGDQLSFHYCGQGRRLAIDHMCSYSPRADQEHLHNRVAFFTDEWAFANLDGFEHLIGFQTSPEVDVAAGLVTGWRLRRQPRTPQETTWNPRGPYRPLEGELQYTRTMVFVKHPGAAGAAAPLDYFVIRDQARGARVKAAYCLHVESDECRQEGPRFNFGALTLFCAGPREFQTERFDWSFAKQGRGGGGESGYRESTVGVRLLSAANEHEFITVLYPSGAAPKMEAIPGGVRVSFSDGLGEEITFRTPHVDEPVGAPYVLLKRGGRDLVALSGRNVNTLRSQGDVGLCLPECGYDFGPVPAWLLQQRPGLPAPLRP